MSQSTNLSRQSSSSPGSCSETGGKESSQISLPITNQSVLILNQNSALCTADKCNSLFALLQKFLPPKCIQEQSPNRALDKFSPGPDFILLRPPVSKAAQELIQSCKEKWARASILALLCVKWDRLFEEGVIFRALVLTASATLQPEDINLPQQTLKPSLKNTVLRQAKTNMIHSF